MKNVVTIAPAAPFLIAAVLSLQGGTGFCQQPAARPGASAPVVLRARLKAGTVHNSQVTTAQKVTQIVNGGRVELTQAIGFGYRVKVLSVDPGGTARVSYTYRSVTFHQQGPKGSIDYDSRRPPRSIPLMAKGMATLVGQSFTARIAPDGRVFAVRGMSELLNRMIRSLDIPAGPMRASLEKQLKDQFGEKAVAELLEQTTRIYPNRPVRIGDSWNVPLVLTHGMPLILDTRYTLASRHGGIATLRVSSTVRPNMNAAPVAIGPLTMRYLMSGRQQGVMEVIEATGWSRKGHLTQDFSGKITMVNGRNTASWPITVKGTFDTAGD